jgi:hypothetical protein
MIDGSIISAGRDAKGISHRLDTVISPKAIKGILTFIHYIRLILMANNLLTNFWLLLSFQKLDKKCHWLMQTRRSTIKWILKMSFYHSSIGFLSEHIGTHRKSIDHVNKLLTVLDNRCLDKQFHHLHRQK